MMLSLILASVLMPGPGGMECYDYDLFTNWVPENGGAATFLRKIGIDIGFEREGRARTRTIRVTTAGKPASPETGGVQASASSAPPADWPKVSSGSEFASPGLRTVGNVANGSAGQTGATVRANPLMADAETEADGADATHPHQSAQENAGWRARL